VLYLDGKVAAAERDCSEDPSLALLQLAIEGKRAAS
jgi:hypothetical protein